MVIKLTAIVFFIAVGAFSVDPANWSPFMPWIPVSGMLACLGLMAFLPTITWVRFLVWTLVGIVLYFGYGFRRSRLAVADPGGG